MVLKKSNIAGIALLLALAATPVPEAFADAGANNLVQLDLKRSSNNSVDVTLFTSNSYNDNVLVRKKSDNKYVILIPKVQSNGYSNSSLSGVKDLVANIDVKTVNDTNGGYTKVTLITTKPLDIKTSTVKSSPVSEEQKEYKTLIAQANAVKNNIAKQTPPKKLEQPKTEITVNKSAGTAKSAQKNTTVSNKAVNSTKTEPQKIVKQQKTAPIAPKLEQKPEIKQQAKAPEIKLQEINPQDDRLTRRQQLAELIEEVKQEKQAESAPQETITPVQTVAGTTFNEPVKDIKELPQHDKTSFITAIKTKLNNLHLPKPIKFTLLGLFGLFVLSKLLKGLNKNKINSSDAMAESLNRHQPIINTVKYNKIVNNNELSWQQKYQSYLDESAKPVPRAGNKGHYAFIKTPAENIEQPQNTDNVQNIENKRAELEKLLEQEIPSNNTTESAPEIVEVFNEDDAIQKTIKFKAFDTRRPSLNITSRDKIKSRFKKYENELPFHEQQNIELGQSLLHSNPRKLKNANLDVADVENRGIRMKYKPSEYIMSSVDEFFSIIDKEANAKKEIVKPKITLPQPAANIETGQSKHTNPITQLRNETKSSYINGLIVKSGFNIDANKGFYIVNLDGKSALIGKVNDEVFVLKKFDTNVTNPIQVRHDNANVYMVKAGGFKSLVEVNDDKMGVLIEL